MSLGNLKDELGAAPIVRRKLSDHVLDRLKAMIVSGEYGPGQTLPSERELMAAYGVGRPAIREAMQALSNAGLITIKHGERARVRPLSAKAAFSQLDMVAQLMLSASPAMVESLRRARRSFELGVVREAARLADETDLAGLEALLDEMAQGVKSADAFAAAERRFHTRLVAVVRNVIFDAMAETVLGWWRDHQIDTAAITARARAVLSAHADTVRALKARDPDAAEAALAGYFDVIAP